MSYEKIEEIFMRIIAGKAKGHLLQAPKGMHTRPTTDRVKEAIFSTLGGIVQNAVVLDAYAGSGALGLEALSRGAKQGIFLEKDRNAIQCIRQNLEHTKLAKQAVVWQGLAEKLLTQVQGKYHFDLVFLDPPYQTGQIALLEPLLLLPGMLAEDVVVVLETTNKNQELFTNVVWHQYKTASYGDTAVVYFGLKI